MSDLAFYDLESKWVVVPQILSHLMRPRGMPLRVIPGSTSTDIFAVTSIPARLMRRHLPLQQCSMCVPCLQSFLSGSSCCDVAAAIRYSWLRRFVVPPCPKLCVCALQGPPLSPRSSAAPTAIAITARAVSPRDGQEGIEGTRGPPLVAESNANTRFVVTRVPMAPLGAGRFSFLGAGGGDFLLVGVLGGVGPSGGSGGLEAVLLGLERGGGDTQS